MQAPCGARLRAWSFATETDLDAPHRSGRAYRFSPMRSAQRVLLASGERLGLLTDGEELRLLLCDPARPDSHIAIPLAGTAGWRARSLAPDSYRLVLALAAPKGHCGAARGAGCGSAEPDTGDQGSARAGARRNRRLPAGGTRPSGQRRRTRPAPARGRVMGRRADPGLPPAVHPEAGKRGQSGVRVQLCLHQPVARRAVAQSGAGAVGATTAGSWPRHRPHAGGRVANSCSACFATGCRAASCR